MSDLNSYFQVAPGPAAFMLGQQQALANDQTQSETSRIQALTQGLNISNDQSTKMNPLLLSHQGLLNDELSAKIPGFAAESGLNQLKLDSAKQTQSSDISKTLSDNHVALIKNNATELAQKAQALGIVGAALASGQGQVAGPGAAMNIPTLLQKAGLDPNDPYVQGVVSHAGGLGMNPQQLGQHIYQVAQQTLKLSEPYLQTTDAATIRGKAEMATGAAHNAALIQMNTDNINAGKYNRSKLQIDLNSALLKSRDARQTAEIYGFASAAAKAAGDDDEAARLTALAQDARDRAAEDATNKGMGQPGVDAAALAGLPPKARATATAPIGAHAPAPDPTPPVGNPLTPTSGRTADSGGRVPVIGPDGKPGTLPAEQVKDALSHGYKLRGQ